MSTLHLQKVCMGTGQINWKYCLCFSAPLIYLYNQQKHFQNMLFLYSYTFFSFSWKKNFSLINSICHQNLRFVIYDIDDDSGDLSSQDPLGTAECRLGQVGVVFHLTLSSPSLSSSSSSSPSPSSSNSSAVQSPGWNRYHLLILSGQCQLFFGVVFSRRC